MKFLNLLVGLGLFNCSFAQVNYAMNDTVPDEIEAGLKIFLDTLYSVCQRKDTARLFPMIYEDIYNMPTNGNNGTQHDLQGFKDIWEMSDPQHSLFWNIVTENLKEGGILCEQASGKLFSRETALTYFMPRIFIQEHNFLIGNFDDCDSWHCHVNIKSNLPVYSVPSEDNTHIVRYLEAGKTVGKAYDIDGNEVFQTYFSPYSEKMVSIATNEWVNARYFYKNSWAIEIQEMDGAWQIVLFSKFE